MNANRALTSHNERPRQEVPHCVTPNRRRRYGRVVAGIVNGELRGGCCPGSSGHPRRQRIGAPGSKPLMSWYRVPAPPVSIRLCVPLRAWALLTLASTPFVDHGARSPSSNPGLATAFAVRCSGVISTGLSPKSVLAGAQNEAIEIVTFPRSGWALRDLLGDLRRHHVSRIAHQAAFATTRRPLAGSGNPAPFRCSAPTDSC